MPTPTPSIPSPKHTERHALIGVTAEQSTSPTLSRAASCLATELGLPLVTYAPNTKKRSVAASPKNKAHQDDLNSDPNMLLTLTEERVELRWMSEPGTRPLFVNLEKLDTTSNSGGTKKQPLAKAIGFKKIETEGRLSVLDCTAGFGEDTWLLASLGCEVTALERNPVIATLLADGLRRAATQKPEIASHIRVISADATSFLTDPAPHGYTEQPDVIYLDPMFPVKTKSAKEGKNMRMLREIVGEDADSDQLIEKAARLAKHRVVVKRPLKAPLLSSGLEPVSQHMGKAVRYDVYSASQS